MKKLNSLIVVLIALVLMGCAGGEPTLGSQGKHKQEILSDNEVTIFGLKFDSLFKVQVGDNTTVSDNEGTTRVPQ